MRAKASGYLEESIANRGDSMHKGPEVGLCLVYQKASVAGVEETQGRVSGNEVRGVMRGQIILMTLVSP